MQIYWNEIKHVNKKKIYLGHQIGRWLIDLNKAFTYM